MKTLALLLFVIASFFALIQAQDNGVFTISDDAVENSEEETGPVEPSATTTIVVDASTAVVTDVPTESDNESDDETTTVITTTITVTEAGNEVPTESDNESDDEPSATEAGEVPTESDNESDDEPSATEAGEVPTESDNESDEEPTEAGKEENEKKPHHHHHHHHHHKKPEEEPEESEEEKPEEKEEESEDDEDTLYRCGPKYGKCREWECCSKYGWCGVTREHCSLEAGCQSEFGKCYGNRSKKVKTVVKTKTATKADVHPWKCGEGIGSCKEGYCCSKYGWCGKSEAYCSKNKGCQSEFGKCW